MFHAAWALLQACTLCNLVKKLHVCCKTISARLRVAQQAPMLAFRFPYANDLPPQFGFERPNPKCNTYPSGVSPLYSLPPLGQATFRNCALTENQLKQASVSSGP